MTDIIQNLPIEHLSYSSMKAFCSNSWQFKKNYILGIWDTKTSLVATAGKGMHKFCEIYFDTGNIQVATNEAIKFINMIPDKSIDFGKTGSRQQILKDLDAGIKFFLQEQPEVGEVLATEKSVIGEFMVGDLKAPVPVKAITDLVTRKNSRIHLWDWKLVSTFSDTEEEQADFIMQSMFNYMTIKYAFNEEPLVMNFVEIKKTKNQDGSPQLQIYEIIYEKHPEYFDYFYRLYTAVIRSLANPNFIFLPNFGDRFYGRESWQDFTNELMDFNMPTQVNHKSPLTRNLDQIDYVASVMDTPVGKDLLPHEKILAKMLEFGIRLEYDSSIEGANVTLHKFLPSRGIPMSKIKKYEDDLSLALESKSVRIEAPLKGTKYIGVEVGNKDQKVVNWSEDLLENSSLMLPIGVDVSGNSYKLDLAKAPHLLVAGATGSGKSVGLNVFINTLIKQNIPDNLGLVLIDPKRTEFVNFEGEEHLLADIVTESDVASEVLEWAVTQMEKRYIKLRENKAKNIDDYLKNGGIMQKIVIVVDELADLMLSPQSKMIESSIIKLAQKSRASGIHLILATQRPSVDVVTGTLKANFPTRIAYMTSTGVDSKVVLDQNGAEQLLGNGDCLVMNPREKGLVRLQGYYL